MNVGAHIPSKNAIEEIKLRKGDTFQIFISSPQMWKSPKPREDVDILQDYDCLLYTSPSPRDGLLSRMPSSA